MTPARAQLIEAAQLGHAGAIAELMKVCQPDIRRFARRSCSNAEDSEDAVQVALWQVYRKIGALRSIATFTSWLFRIVERECYRLFRIRSAAQPLDEALMESAAAPAVPLDLRLDLARAIAALPAPYRTVLILRDIDEVTAPEAAEQLGISVEAVKSRLHRARAAVRERLMQSGYWSELAPEDQP